MKEAFTTIRRALISMPPIIGTKTPQKEKVSRNLSVPPIEELNNEENVKKAVAKSGIKSLCTILVDIEHHS